ncbi:MAG: hypothetical protein K2M17_01555, partial [Bacilli bacterium]|nr:hypothetical protein [Bacilli bacterium]
MELENLSGNIIGIISSDKSKEKYEGRKVEEIIHHKLDEALKMVNLSPDCKTKYFEELSSRDKNKVILASQLHKKTITLYDFSKGMIKKDIEFFKRLFKKIITY